MSAASTHKLSVQVLDFEDSCLLIQLARLVCDFCSSGQRFACGFPEFLFFFNDTATTEIYTLSLHDALPLCTLPMWQSESLTQRDSGRSRAPGRSEEHTSELQSQFHLVCRLLLAKKKSQTRPFIRLTESLFTIGKKKTANGKRCRQADERLILMGSEVEAPMRFLIIPTVFLASAVAVPAADAHAIIK